jgi:hypothetical protein
MERRVAEGALRWERPGRQPKSRMALVELGVAGVDGHLVAYDWAGPTGGWRGNCLGSPGTTPPPTTLQQLNLPPVASPVLVLAQGLGKVAGCPNWMLIG